MLRSPPHTIPQVERDRSFPSYHPCQRAYIHFVPEGLAQPLGRLGEHDYVERRDDEAHRECPADDRYWYHHDCKEDCPDDVLEQRAYPAEQPAYEVHHAAGEVLVVE